MVTPGAAGQASAYAVAAAVPDPELPQLTLADLGILRAVDQTPAGLVVTITPTYSGCPALREIAADLRARLAGAGFAPVTVRTILAPPWTTDWITPDGHRKLAAAGIAPPSPAPRHGTRATFIPLGAVSPGPVSPGRVPLDPFPLTLDPPPSPPCPRCGSAGTERTAEFSGTACKSLHRCTACGEPFEAVKPL
jgi:ring-1,2-phenylacetyl-CoA epoxidase subunit PaaD